MVTAPSDVAATADWADAVLQAGADLLRINGAHESPREWASTASTFKSRAAALGRTVRIFVDLPGPKLRTKIRQLDVPVLRFRRHKDRLGRTTAPTSVLLVAKYEGGEQIPVSARWLTELKDGDKLRLTDAGGRKRTLVVRGSGDGGVVAECNHSLYITSGLRLEWRRGEDVMGEGHVGALPGQPKVFRVSIGDGFLLNESGQSDDPSMRVLAFPEPRLLEQVSPGERVIFDDGRIIAVVEELRSDGVLCRVQRARKSPIRLRSGKGIAFPDSKFSLEMVGRRDEVALEFALKHADGLAVSFINSPQDVALVGERVKRAGKPGFGMILKLETRGAMRNLGAILFEALKYDAVGLMIARGDLAVELSFERLAEMQEELLWFGEACHLPVIWATQVLDSVARTGLPTRAEITDAAMSMRAECVMLNRGPHIDIATRMLADIIRKMEAHQYKKLSLDRPLSVAGTGTMLEPQ
jgi:pyruvate kinase